MSFSIDAHPDSLDETSRGNPDDLDEIDSLFLENDGPSDEALSGSRTSRIVALISPKGGTGKTSVAVMLAGFLTTRRRQAGLMDLDPQRGVEKWSRAGGGLPFPIYTFDSNRGAAAFRSAVRQATHEVDLLIIDTPPSMGPAIRLALQVADLALIPTGASNLDQEATLEAIDAAKNARHGRDGDLPRIMVVPSRQDARTRLAKDFDHRFKSLKLPIAPAVGQRVEVAVAADSGRLVRSSTVAGNEFRRLARSVWSFLRRLDA